MLKIMEQIMKQKEEGEGERQELSSNDLLDIFQTNAQKLFRCNVCRKSYAKIRSYEAHLRIHGIEGMMLTCPVCVGQFTCSQELKTHMSTHTKKRKLLYACRVCDQFFSSMAARRRHKLLLHASQWVCKPCSLTFRKHSAYISHVKSKHQVKTEDEPSVVYVDYMCSECGEPFATHDDLVEHLENHREVIKETTAGDNDVLLLTDGYNADPGCDVTIIELSDNENGLDVPGGLFMCGMCGEHHSDLSSMRKHLNSAHSDEIEPPMTEVGPIFEPSFSCSMCEQSFQTRDRLRSHEVTHTNSKQFKCDLCGSTFKGRSGLYLHKKRVHQGRMDFECEFCGKRFCVKTQKDNHVRVHTGEKPFKCETCGSLFRAQSGLHAHRKTHTDERPFKCELCGKHLRLLYNLKLHMRTHTGEKPYKCEVCGRCFSQPSDCKKHIKTHGINQYL